MKGLKACILTLYLFMFALNLFLHRFRNELARSLTNRNHSYLVCNKFISFWLFLCSPQQLSDLSSTTVPVPASVGETHSHSSSSCRPRCPSSFHQVTTPMRWHSKRIKFIYFLARTRIVSRLMMVRTVCNY